MSEKANERQSAIEKEKHFFTKCNNIIYKWPNMEQEEEKENEWRRKSMRREKERERIKVVEWIVTPIGQSDGLTELPLLVLTMRRIEM